MSDTMTSEQRSRTMARVKSANTKPEMIVRSMLHRMGYRFRLHRKDLPGKPDIVLPRHRKIVLVHGCFWHGHDCPKGRRPKTRVDFWNAKLDANMERDWRNVLDLENSGWRIATVWECELSNPEAVRSRLSSFMTDG